MIKLLLLFLFVSCSAFKEEELQNREEFLLQEVKKINYCQEKPFQLIGSSAFATKTIGNYLKKDKALSSFEKFALWALFQMNVHPEASSPNSRLQILVQDQKKLSYFEYSGKTEKSRPFLDGLEDFLVQNKQKHTLLDLAKILDRDINIPVPIGADLADFLKENSVSIQKNPYFKSIYFKANHVITETETLPHLNFSKLLLSKKEDFTFNSTLSQDTHLNTSVSCNLNLSLMKEFIGPLGYSNHFGFKLNDLIILGTSSLTPNKEKSFENTFLFGGLNRDYRPVFCSLKKEDAHLLFVSGNGKGPGQLLYHLIESDISTKYSLPELDEELSDLRYITLNNPKRIALESRRSSRGALNKFLNSDLPVYSVPALGNLWGYASLKMESGFLKDSRNESYLFCE